MSGSNTMANVATKMGAMAGAGRRRRSARRVSRKGRKSVRRVSRKGRKSVRRTRRRGSKRGGLFTSHARLG